MEGDDRPGSGHGDTTSPPGPLTGGHSDDGDRAEPGTAGIPAGPPEYPPLFAAADSTAIGGERASVRFTVFDILLVLVGAIFTAAVSFTANAAAQNTLSAIAAVIFLITWAEKTASVRFPFTRSWFEGRSVAETVKSISWRYMMHVSPFQGESADEELLTALHSVLRDESLAVLPEAATRVDERQITPYLRAVRALPLEGRKSCYLRQRLEDQLGYYESRAEGHGVSARRWRRAGLVFRAATFVFAILRFWVATAASLVGVFVNLTVAVTAWTQLIKHDELTHGYARVAHSLQILRRRLEASMDEASVERVVIETEGVISQEESAWKAKRVQ
ncbi:MAG TPA: DUF4231 domain-containing protein [Chloroflexota bacterium]|nr:DUF4231 domain-containing protein [Chloroflexota bacterium]